MSPTVLAMIFTHKLCTAICIDIETFCNTKPHEVKLCVLSEDFPYFGLNVDVTFYPSEDSVVYWKCKKCKHEGDHVHSKDAGCKLSRSFWPPLLVRHLQQTLYHWR